MTMWLNRLVPVLLLMALIVGAWQLWRGDGLRTASGVLAPDAPTQTTSDRSAPFMVNGFEVRPVAKFSLRARILSNEHYTWDVGAKVSPTDLALGWGRMSDTDVVKQVKFSHGYRAVTYRNAENAPIPRTELLRSSANMHMIPADAEVEALLRQARAGEIAEIDGYLVNVRGPDGFTWNTSLTREDTGANSCEVVYVQRMTLSRT
jgi:hypothetical protein